MRHVHADVIIAWADGKKIQWRSDQYPNWQDVVGDPVWGKNNDYRVKPERKRDEVSYDIIRTSVYHTLEGVKDAAKAIGGCPIVEITRNGETGKLTVEVVE